jgi:hypothetical protein
MQIVLVLAGNAGCLVTKGETMTKIKNVGFAALLVLGSVSLAAAQQPVPNSLAGPADTNIPANGAQVNAPNQNSLAGPADSNIPAHAGQVSAPIQNSLGGPADSNIPAHAGQTNAPAAVR